METDDRRCPSCGEIPAPLGIGHLPNCPRLTNWDGLAENTTPGRLGNVSPEETLSQEFDADAEASHRDESLSPAVRAEQAHAKHHLVERKNDSLCFAFAVANPAAQTEVVTTGSIPPGVYEVSLYLRTTAAAVSRVNANLNQGDLPVGTVLTDSATTTPTTFPRVTVRPGEAIRVVSIATEGAVTYFGELVATMVESYGRG